MITAPVIQAFFLGLLRLVAMGAAFYIYKGSHGDAQMIALAGGLAFFATTGQAVDVLKVDRQVKAALADTATETHA